MPGTPTKTSQESPPAAGKKSPRETPAMKQYYGFKKRHPDCVLFFRMGDFYEMFDDDAVTVSKALGLTLTERTEGVPMAGVPYHSVENYLRRMIDQGFRVAVCEQVQDPKEAKGVVDRAVTRVLTPGTLVDEGLLEEGAANTLAAVCFLTDGDAPDGRVALAMVELSTGAFTVLECEAGRAVDELLRRNVNELLHVETGTGQTAPRAQRMIEALGVSGTARPAWQFRPAEAMEALLGQYGVASLEGFGLSDDDPVIAPAGAVVRYLRDTQDIAPPQVAPTGEAPRIALCHLAPPRREAIDGTVALSAASLRSLEIERTIRGGQADGSLLSVFTGAAGCRTSMGKRLLRQWLCCPLSSRDEIERRQRAVATLVEDRRTATALRAGIERVQDVARIAGRLGLGRATPRDLAALGASLSRLEEISGAIENAPAFAKARRVLSELADALAPLAERIERTCVDQPPSHLREGGLIRDGVDAELDEARALQRDGATWLAEYQGRLAAEHNLPAIKVGYNRVFGYYIELSAANASKAPDFFTRKQTLKNAERYITPELKEFEEKATTAESRAIAREQSLFADLCARGARESQRIAAFARTVAGLDALCAFAEKAARSGWTRPEIVDEPVLDIAQGRHPVLSEILGDDFVPNDAALGTPESAARLALITGPNMAGKSTYIRQTALLTLLAHTGSFVPAERARIGVVDAIFTRIGADDALHQGQSTFMVEMTETANILHNATDRSLIILDEIGRGTSTLDGLSLAWSVAEALAGGERPGPRTLFATHYHELTDLEERLAGRVGNLHVKVREWGDEIVFLHVIKPGRTDQSYGIHVAKLAGMPPAVVSRARELLSGLSVSHGMISAGVDGDAAPPTASARVRSGERDDGQLGLFREYLRHPVVDELEQLRLDELSPMQAFDALRALQSRLDGED